MQLFCLSVFICSLLFITASRVYILKKKRQSAMIFHILHLLFSYMWFANANHGHIRSPCPKLYTIESVPKNNTYFADLTLLTDEEITGVWVRLKFDKPPMQLGNWFGEIININNTDYLIQNPNYVFKENAPLFVRFYVSYDLLEFPPQLTSYQLNGKVVCPERKKQVRECHENGQTTATPVEIMGQLKTSKVVKPNYTPLLLNTDPRPPHNDHEEEHEDHHDDLHEEPHEEPHEDHHEDLHENNRDKHHDETEEEYFEGDLSLVLNHTPLVLAIPETCGLVSTASPLIYKGQESFEGEFPWHAAIYHTKLINLAYTCGATLISRDYLVTAAHCVTRPRSKASILPKSLVIYLGKHFLKQWSSLNIQERHVKSVIIHPDYNPQTYANDIALLQLNKPADVTNFVRPICLWDNSENMAFTNKQGVVAGWGFDETGSVTDGLTKANMPIVSLQTCVASFPEFYNTFMTNRTFCAGFRNGTTVCNGDSGGGMVFPKRDQQSKSVRWYLRGLISIGVGLQNTSKVSCDTNNYVIFTDVAKYVNWIKQSLKQ